MDKNSKANDAIVIQARLGSKRFPKKILFKVNKKETVLEYLIERLKFSKEFKKLIVITTKKKIDNKIVKICKKKNISIFRGSENDVLDRYYKCAKKFKIKNIVRITSDCPLVDPKMIDQMYKKFLKQKFDYISNTTPSNKSTYPNGMDIEIFNFKSLLKAFKEVNDVFLREHVTHYFWMNPSKFKQGSFRGKKNLSNVRITLDYHSDLKIIKKIIKNFKNYRNFSLKEIICFLNSNKK